MEQTPVGADPEAAARVAQQCVYGAVRQALGAGQCGVALHAAVAGIQQVQPRTGAHPQPARAIAEHGIAVTLDLLPGLPPVKADADQIGQIVLNLIVNAQQALGARDLARRLIVSTGLAPMTEGDRRRVPRVWLRVRDNGPGIDAELRERIFEPFFTTKSEGVGTGLGLAVSRSIARDHGGELTLQDDEDFGDGACFCLQLPVSGEPEAAETEPVPLADADERSARLLVVDDEREIAELIGEMLSGAGYEVMGPLIAGVPTMQTTPWRGVFPAVTTKFHADESLDFAGTARHIDFQIRNGIHGVVCCGSLGEASTLALDEKLAVATLSALPRTAPTIPTSESFMTS